MSLLPITDSSLDSNPACIAYREANRLLQRMPRYRMPEHLMRLDQLRQLWQIDTEAYAECAIPFECFRRWWQRYPQGNTVVLDGNGLILASIGIWALMPEQFEQFTSGQIPESALLPVTLSRCEKTPQHYWYISGLLLRKEYRRRPTSPLEHLLKHAIPNWLSSPHVEYPIHVAAMAEYVDGDNLLENFGFTRKRHKEEMPDRCCLYQFTICSEEHAEEILRSRSLL